MVDFGKRLKELRQQAGITQKDLAMKLGITKSVISYYELSERSPSPEILIKIATIFHTTTDFLLGIEPCQKSIDITDLPEEDVKLLQHMLETLRNKNKK